MTSPSQLRYLDAIGIPVWVSRELVIAESQVIVNPEPKRQSTSSNVKAHPATHSNSSSAQSLIDSLGDVSAKSKDKKAVIETETKPVLEKAIKTSVDKTSLESKTADEVVIESSPQTNQNLLFKSPQQYVYAKGNKSADWMVIGHSPELFNGIGQEPFAGEAGDLLLNMLRAVGLEQPLEQAYLINIKDLSPSIETNVTEKLKHDLLNTIAEVNPKMLLFVGQIAAQNLLDCADPLVIMRSKVHSISADKIPCVVTYYPDYLLQKPTDKRKAWDDLKLAMKHLS